MNSRTTILTCRRPALVLPALVLPALVLSALVLSACGEEQSVAAESARIEPSILLLFGPLPNSIPHPRGPASDAQIELGRRLFFEKRLSITGTLSCNSCHGLDTYGVDGQRFSTGHAGQLGGRNAPSVYNAAGHVAQFWDGRAADVEEQAKGPILNPDEMGMPSEAAVLRVLNDIPEYVSAFAKAFPGEDPSLTYDNLGRAIGAFERQLTTPSRWDAFLAGETDAITNGEKRGFTTFVEVGCPVCHNGPFVGGRLYQKLGLVMPWPGLQDKGRGEVTGKSADDYFFKVPSLRNVEKTGPYFHDGSVKHLGNAIKKMARHQLGVELETEKVESILTWLKCLTGKLPGVTDRR